MLQAKICIARGNQGTWKLCLSRKKLERPRARFLNCLTCCLMVLERRNNLIPIYERPTPQELRHQLIKHDFSPKLKKNQNHSAHGCSASPAPHVSILFRNKFPRQFFSGLGRPPIKAAFQHTKKTKWKQKSRIYAALVKRPQGIGKRCSRNKFFEKKFFCILGP